MMQKNIEIMLKHSEIILNYVQENTGKPKNGLLVMNNAAYIDIDELIDIYAADECDACADYVMARVYAMEEVGLISDINMLPDGDCIVGWDVCDADAWNC